VPEELIAKADGTIAIPCPGPVESLNAAVAASILLYEVSRQRSALIGKPPNQPQRSSKSQPHAGEQQGAKR
jgi:TrmH family RNA methyltransferase